MEVLTDKSKRLGFDLNRHFDQPPPTYEESERLANSGNIPIPPSDQEECWDRGNCFSDSQKAEKTKKSTWHFEITPDNRCRFGKGWKIVITAGFVVLFPVALVVGTVVGVGKLAFDHVID